MLNKVILMGRLTKDPELKYTTSNIPVCTFTLAVDRNFKQGGERQADFIPIVAWRNNAEFTSKYFKKGMQVVVSGRLQTRNWDDQEGKRHFITEIVVDETYFAEKKRDSDNLINSYDVNDFSKEVEGFMPIDADDDLPF
jgi:single-strand DNA-binding protein